jgi:hypothetical protein
MSNIVSGTVVRYTEGFTPQFDYAGGDFEPVCIRDGEDREAEPLPQLDRSRVFYYAHRSSWYGVVVGKLSIVRPGEQENKIEEQDVLYNGKMLYIVATTYYTQKDRPNLLGGLEYVFVIVPEDAITVCD